MNDKKKYPPVYQRYSDSGTQLHNLGGVEATLKANDDAASDSVMWLVKADTLGGLVPLAGYDHLRDVHRTWWEVQQVGEPTDGSYPLLCTRWKDGAA